MVKMMYCETHAITVSNLLLQIQKLVTQSC